MAECHKDIVEQIGVAGLLLKQGKVQGSISSRRFDAALKNKYH
jgi:hypothetical protein